MQEIAKELLAFLIHYFQTSDLIVQVAIIIAITCAFLTFVAYCTVFYLRIYYARIDAKRKNLKNAVEELLAIMIADEASFFEGSEESIRKNISAHFKDINLGNRFNRDTLRGEFVLLLDQLGGSSATNLKKVYYVLELHKDLLRDIHRKRDWKIVSSALHDLGLMGIQSAKKEVNARINDENAFIRQEAIVAYVHLNPEHPFDFLDNFNQELTEWQQLNLFLALSQNPFATVPEFKRWLLVENEYVVDFCLKMVSFYNQLESVPELLHLVAHANPEIRADNYYAIQKLQADDAVPALLQVYELEPIPLKLDILKAFGEIRAEETRDFLIARMHDPDFSLALQCAVSISKFPGWGQQYLEELLPYAGERMRKIILHALDKRIDVLVV